MRKTILTTTVFTACLFVTSSCVFNFGNRDKEEEETTEAAAPAAEPEKAPSASQVVPHVYSKAYDAYTNIRQSPSAKSAILGQLRNGPEGAVLLGMEGEWLKVSLNGIEGYVHSKYVQDEPTIAYVGTATLEQLAGVWSGNGGYVLVVFDNGTFEWGYDYTNCRGTYILQNNEIAFKAKVTEDGLGGFNEVLPINIKAGKLGDYSKHGFMSESEMEEGYGGYGCMTYKQFKAAGKETARMLSQKGLL